MTTKSNGHTLTARRVAGQLRLMNQGLRFRCLGFEPSQPRWWIKTLLPKRLQKQCFLIHRRFASGHDEARRHGLGRLRVHHPLWTCSEVPETSSTLASYGVPTRSRKEEPSTQQGASPCFPPQLSQTVPGLPSNPKLQGPKESYTQPISSLSLRSTTRTV